MWSLKRFFIAQVCNGGLKGEGILIPIEVEAVNRVSAVDGRSNEAFMSDHKKATPFGIIVYRGKEAIEVKKYMGYPGEASFFLI